MRILGITDHYISGAALIEDGKLVAAVNEERLDRRKMVMGWPRLSIASVLEMTGLKPEDIDYVSVASRWGHFLDELVDFSEGVFSVDEGAAKNLFFNVGSKLATFRSRLPILEKLYYDLRKPIFAKRRTKIREVLGAEFGLSCPVEFVWHHHAHAASAYYSSGYDDALVLTLDGSGDGHSSHVYDVRGGNWNFLHSVPSFDGIGNYYGYATHLCGFKTGKHEGKVTGLAAHGDDRYRGILNDFIRYQDGTMVNVGNAFRTGAVDALRKALPADFTREDLAASIQNHSEDIAQKYVTHWATKTGRRNVALAGGVHANVKINQRIHQLDAVDSVFVYPGMSDEGLAAGAAMLLYAQKRPGEPIHGQKAIDHVYLGPDFSDKEIAAALDAKKIPYQHVPDGEPAIARLIADGYVVARMNGRMEHGPRALGNRSLMYRPDDPAVNDWLNERLGRTEFMPFAPATLAEDARECFVDVDGAEDTARFMTVTFDCTETMKKSSPGVVHIDGTARPQLVSETDNASYYRVIKEFKKLTGLSSIVNTSFNIHEEPIVCSPEDAIRAFEHGNLDVLAIGPFVVRNPEADARVKAAAEGRGDVS